MYAIPTPGRSVPLPGHRQLLPAAGRNIGPMTQYWQRRLRDGDITVSESAPLPKAAPTPTAMVSTNNATAAATPTGNAP